MVANIITTHRCNLRCRHCYYINNLSMEDEAVGFENWRILANKREKLDIDRFNFTGGEASLCPELISYFMECKQKNIDFSMFTNGIEVGSSMIDICNDFCVSVDGIGSIHDSVRNLEGAFERTLRTLQELREKDKKVHIQTTISRINIEHLNSLLELYVEMMPSLKSISLVAAVNQGNTFNNSISLNESELIMIKDFKKELLEKLHYHIFVKDNIFTPDQLGEFVLSSKSVFPIWIDLISGEVYVMTEEYKTDVKNLSLKWIYEQYEMIRKKIDRKLLQSNYELYLIENLLQN